MAYSTILSLLEAMVASWDGAPIAWDARPSGPSVTAAQTSKQPWVRFTLQPGATLPAGKAVTPLVRPTGLVSIQIFTALGIGSNAAYTLCDSLVPVLQYQKVGKLETLELSVTRAGEQDDYFQLNASIPYRYN